MKTMKIDTIIIDRTTEEGKRVKISPEVLSKNRKNNGIPVMIINQTPATILEDYINHGLNSSGK